MGGKHTLSMGYKLYQMTYFIGVTLSVTFYTIICKLFPPPGLGIAEGPANYNDDLGSSMVIEGLAKKELIGDTKQDMETKSEEAGVGV